MRASEKRRNLEENRLAFARGESNEHVGVVFADGVDCRFLRASPEILMPPVLFEEGSI